MSQAMKQTVALFVAVVLAGCAGVGKSEEKKEEKALPRAEAPAALVFLHTCPISQHGAPEAAFMTALATAVIQSFAPSLIGAVFDAGVKALEERADALTASSTAHANGTFYRRETTANGASYKVSYGCLVFIRGGMSEKGAALKVDESIWSEGRTKLVNEELKKAKPAWALSGPPELYIEFALDYPVKQAAKDEVVTGTDGKPLTDPKGGAYKLPNNLDIPSRLELRPVELYYLKSGAKRNSGNSKQLVLQTEIKARTPKDGSWQDTTLLDATFDLGQVRIGSSLKGSVLNSRASVFGQMPPPSLIDATVVVRFPNVETPKQGSVKVIDLVDVNARVTVTETEDGGDIERLLAKTAKDKKGDLTKPVLDAINDWVKKQQGGTATQ